MALRQRLAETETLLAHTRKELKESKIALEIEQEQHQRLIEDWNAVLHMLDRVYSLKVYSNEIVDRESLWTVEYSGKVSTGHKTIADAYEVALHALKGDATWQHP